jgi:hypothetical protein
MLNQNVTWLPKVLEPNLYGDFQYGDSKIIKCRKEDHIEEVADSNGRIHQSKHIFYTREKVQLDDKLDGELVVKLYDMNTLGGNFHLRRLITI